tara:strand:+ start:348 stop:737 length:390 start_codon:yes stop_codon:yes gene_type:complete
MILLTDITGIWCYNLIMANDQGSHAMMHSDKSKFKDFMMFALVFIYIGSYFMPSHWGAMCSGHAPPLGSVALCLFYIVWTFYSVNQIKNDPMLKLKDTPFKDLVLVAKNLSLKEYSGEFNHQEMILAQR